MNFSNAIRLAGISFDIYPHNLGMIRDEYASYVFLGQAT